MNFHIHLEQQKKQQGLTEICSGYHALFAFEILRHSFAEFRERAWNPMMASHLFEAWDRQVHLIESLHLPAANLKHSPIFELRFVAYPDQRQIDLFFLGKTFAPTPEQAQSKAKTLGQEVVSLFPFDFTLRPLQDQAEFERAYQSEWITGLANSEQIVEIRRFERLVPNPGNGNGGNNFLYLTHGWRWHLQSMEQVWCALAKYPQRLMFNVSLSPILWDQVDYVYLNELETVVNEGKTPSSLGQETNSALKLYRQLLYQTPRPFTLRMTLVGESAVPQGLANAIGAGLCLLPLQVESNEVTSGANYTLTWPACSEDISLAKLNLTQLNQYDWGAELVGLPIRRLRYAVNAKEAQTVFRIPIPPEGGFPGISLGREVDTEKTN